MKAYTVATGNVDPRIRASRRAVRLIKKQKGLLGAHPCYPDGTIWLFRTENDAKIARNKMEAAGISCGVNICEVDIDDKYDCRDGGAEQIGMEDGAE